MKKKSQEIIKNGCGSYGEWCEGLLEALNQEIKTAKCKCSHNRIRRKYVKLIEEELSSRS